MTKSSHSRREFLTGAISLAALGAAASPASAQRVMNSIDDWLSFNQSGADAWDQPFDRSFAKQWETQPERGFPTVSKDNIAPTKEAIKRYADIVAKGGWDRLPMTDLRVGMASPAVSQLRRHLIMTGDLEASGGIAETFDYYVEKGVKKAQVRHGLPPTGFVDKHTITALNVPASSRLRQLRANLSRLTPYASSTSAGKYVLVNIPAAQIEAVNNNQVVSRHAGVVGKLDRPSPILQSRIHEVNFNKEWFLPPTVIREDVVPKAREMYAKGQDFLAKYKIDAYASYAAYQRGQRIEPRQVNWASGEPLGLFYVQNAGEENPLGYAKINFHNPYAVYMHDTPGQSIFGRNFRAESSGCVRVQNIHQLVAWLLEENGWTVQQVLRMKQTGETLNVTLKRPVPVYWSYITAWATPDGTVNFRRDLYRKDGVDAIASAY
jgi:murein L,D-transpeptidase YcbB/YkuD